MRFLNHKELTNKPSLRGVGKEVKRMRITLLSLCLFLALTLLLTGCGGGGGVVLTAEQVARLFPLAPQGRQWVYDVSKEENATVNGGQYPYHRADTSTKTCTIKGTLGSPTFTVKTTIIEEEEKTTTETELSRWFYTNVNGEVKVWGTQDYDNEQDQWEPIRVFDQPALFLKAGVANWVVGGPRFPEDIHFRTPAETVEATFRGTLLASSIEQETSDTYKVTYTFRNDWTFEPPTGYTLKSTKTFVYKWIIWFKLDFGITKQEKDITFNAELENTTDHSIMYLDYSSKYTENAT